MRLLSNPLQGERRGEKEPDAPFSQRHAASSGKDWRPAPRAVALRVRSTLNEQFVCRRDGRQARNLRRLVASRSRPILRDWRGRGLGRALLLHAFAEFFELRKKIVRLHVDADNPTGAVRLYESVGMSVTEKIVTMGRRLTGLGRRLDEPSDTAPAA
jgi:GNAT superfamily N-acetyltransferase